MSDKNQVQVTLYNLTDDMKALEELLEADTEGQEEAAALIQNEIIGMLKSKTDNIVYFNEYLEDLVEKVDKRAKQLQDLKKTLNNKIESFNNYVLYCMDKLEAPELRGEIKKIKVVKPTKAVEIDDIDQIPVEFIKVKKEVSPMKAEISKAIKAGQQVPGARLVDGKRKVKLSNITL